MSGEISFIEFGVDNAEKGAAFYTALFGWSAEPGPGGNGSNIGGAGVPAGLHGDDAGAAPYVFFRVDDIEAAAQRVRDLGGAVDPMDLDGDEATVARYGRFTMCRDDQGSPFGLHQPPTG